MNAVFQAELDEYVNGLDECRLSRQDVDRGTLLAWLCVLAPEVISSESSSRLASAWYPLESRSRTEISAWLNSMFLRIALYGLSGEYRISKDMLRSCPVE